MQSLINYSNMSIGRSAMSTQEIVSFAKQANQPVVALTDHHSLTGIPQFLSQCEMAGIKGIVGLTLNVTDEAGSCGDIVFLARNEAGFQQLKALITRYGHSAQETGYQPLMGIPKDALISTDCYKLTKDCIVLDGFPGSFAEMELTRLEKSQRTLGALKQRLGDPSYTLTKLAKSRPIGDYCAVYTPGSTSALALAYHSLQQDRGAVTPPVLDSFVHYATNETQLIAAQKGFLLYAGPWLKNIQNRSEALTYVSSRYYGRAMCDPKKLPLGIADKTLSLEDFEPYEKAYTPGINVGLLDGDVEKPSSLNAILSEHWPAFEEGLDPNVIPVYKARFQEELRVIAQLGFENYFINIYQIKTLAERYNNDYMLRGSAVSSLVMHVMGLTPVDPIEEGLLFLRFLSEDREEEPDVDVEFIDQKEMFRALRNAYGEDQLASLCSFNKMKGVKVILSEARDAMLELYELNDVQRKEINAAHDALLKGTRIKTFPDFIASPNNYQNILKKNPAAEHLLELGKYLLEVNLSAGLNAGSMIISPDGVNQSLNVYENPRSSEPDSLPMVPFCKYSIPGTGFIKYDILSNKAFTRLVLGLRNAGLPKDPLISPSDPSIAYVSYVGATLGITQLNGYVGGELSRLINPRSKKELTMIMGLIRSGQTKPDSKLIQSFLAGRNDPDLLNTPPLFRPMLSETYGIMVYEEQMIVMLTDVAGFTYREADKFRSRLKKGDFDAIDRNEPMFFEKVKAKHGLSQEEISRLYQPFRDQRDRFLFSKAHSSAYSYLAVQQCWFKTYYPAHFAAELYMEKGEFKDLKVIVEDWGKITNGGWRVQEGVKDFLNALGKIVIRENKKNTTGYRSKIDTFYKEIETFIVDNGFSSVYVEGEDQSSIASHWTKVKMRLDKVLAHSSTPQSPTVNNNTSEREVKTSPYESKTIKPVNTSAVSQAVDKRTLNEFMQEEDDRDWLKCTMFSQFIPYLAQRGVVQMISVDEKKSASHIEQKFIVNCKGAPKYSIVSCAADSSRITEDNESKGLHSGMHQGAKNSRTEVKYFFEDLYRLGAFPDAPKLGKGVSISDVFKAYVLSSPILLNGTHNIVAQKKIARPLSVPLPPPNDGVFNKIRKELALCLVEKRGFAKEEMDIALNQGLFTLCLKPLEMPRDNRRYMQQSALANFRPVISGVPLTQIPFAPLGYLSDGGVQSVFYSNGDRNRKPGVVRLDHGTNRVKGHFFGNVTPGSDVLWLGEGIFDAIGFNAVQRFVKKVAPDRIVAESNCIALKSTSGVIPFIENIFEVKLSHPNDPSLHDFTPIKTVLSGEDFDAASLAGQGDFIDQTVWHITHDNTPESEHVVHVLQTLFAQAGRSQSFSDQSRVVIHLCNPQNFLSSLSNVMERKATRPEDVILHKGNLSQWLRNNNFFFTSDENGSKLQRQVITQVPLSSPFKTLPDEQKAIWRKTMQKRFSDMTTCLGLGAAFDGDKAGFECRDIVKNFCNLSGVPFVEHMIPEYTFPMQGQDIKLNDQNDYYRVMTELHRNGEHERLHALIDAYTGASSYDPDDFGQNRDPENAQDLHNALKRNK